MGELHIVGDYCVPIMQFTLKGEEFRGMYPHLMYSARLFQVLARCREYGEALTQDERVVPLLLQAQRRQDTFRVDSDLEGRRLALEALRSLAHFELWRPDFIYLEHDLPLSLADDHAGIRAAAAGLWAILHREEVY